MKLPSALIPHADQAKAHADHTTAMMLEDLRENLKQGTDPITLWWNVANSITCCATVDVATAMASALLKLATDAPVESAPTPAVVETVEQWAVVWTPKRGAEPREWWTDTYDEALWYCEQAMIREPVIMRRTVTPWTEHVL